jgi:multiple sugar transport system substrate-binding protein
MGEPFMKGPDAKVSRRDFLKLTAAAAAAAPALLSAAPAAAAGTAAQAAAQAGQKTLKTLKIAKWAHFLPDYDPWFDSAIAAEWGRRHDTQVIVDHIPVEEIAARAAAEAAAGSGHDLFMFPWPPAEYQAHVIDHAEIYQKVSFRHGSLERLSHNSTYNPKTKRYFAFADSYMPLPMHYYEDQWNEVGMRLGPVHYNGLHSGGKRLRAKLGIPCGLALSPSLEGNVTLITLLYSFGARILDPDGNVLINTGARTAAALKYVKSLFDDTAAAEQLTWGPGASARAMVERKTSCTMSNICLMRAAERENPEAAKRMRICPPLVGNGFVFSVPHVTSCSAVWSFAENQEGAKQFLVDLIDNSKNIYEKSGGASFPIFQKTVPDLIVRLENDAHGDPPYKYKELKDALHWTANLGFPGYANPVFMETFNSFVIPRMFMSVLKGEQTPDDAARAAELEVKRIADKWKQV